MDGPPADDGLSALRDLLHPDETQVDEVWIDDSQLLLTDRRLLVRRAAGEPVLRAIDRVNLGPVETRTVSERAHLRLAAQWGTFGAGMLTAWWFVPFEGLARPVDPPAVEFQALYAAVNTLASMLAYVDEAFLATALLAIGWAVGRSALYLRGRNRVVEVAVAGGDPLRFPAQDSTADQLHGLLGAETTTPE